KNNGIIGNISSMGLAMQALATSSEFYAPLEWNLTQACSVVYKHDYKEPMAMAQVLPPIMGKSYLNAGELGCAAAVGPEPTPAPVSNMGTIGVPTWSQPLPITVQFSITNTMKNYFHYSTSVCVPDNSTLLQVMKVAAEKQPDTFCFETIPEKLGPYVISIHGLAGSTEDRTYWQFFSSWSPLQEGVGTYKPKNWELIQAVFSTY
ncbi:IF factor, partial [Dasyornis broadbenti]|nr:IF factor [Dasyornis broadbenti]